jgi:HD-GYP domain-containing protein (c-di-GMP phosphodiesterase class II)
VEARRLDNEVRLADVVAGLSLISDLGFGLPAGEAMRTCLVATALARELNLSESEVADAFYASLLIHVGCISMSHETSVLFGNELTLTRAAAMTDLSDPDDYVATFIPEATRELAPAAKEQLRTSIITRGPSFGRFYDTASSEVVRSTAACIGLPSSTQRTVYELAESWQGDGAPTGLKGDDILPAARIVRVAADAAFFDDIGDVALAIDALKKRAGRTLDPAFVDAFVRDARGLLAEAAFPDPRDRILEVEPKPVAHRTRSELHVVAGAYGNATDLKSPFMHQRSTKVAALASAAAERGGLDTATVEQLRLAALLHDVGRVGVSDVVWEKPGPLTAMEWQDVRTHPYHSERILAMSRTLEPVARIAGMHHERMDGSGYHRGLNGSAIPMAVRILAASDAFVAMTQDRPHRAALTPDEATLRLRADATSGLLDADAVSAVLDEAGHGRGTRTRTLRPAGLSQREVEVLRLVARGLSNPQIAEQLVLSRRTVEHHVQHIYTKIGFSTRPAAALFAIQHDLLD